MPNINNLHFLNHASFAIERNSEILLIDPWFQGTAFNDGWALLDQSTADSSIIEWLKLSNKKIFIWYSHEHSDHFSMSFLKMIQKEKIDATIIFHRTLDGRVTAFLRSQKLDVIDAEDGKPVLLGDSFCIATWSYRNDDSFCVIKSNEMSILNINDCVISTENEARIVMSKLSQFSNHIDILFTQFGYANWIGNEEDKDERIKVANQKCHRISNQDKVFNPSVIIPFASFVYFCHPENFYLNDAQNSPKELITERVLDSIKGKIFFLKPKDKISLNSINSELPQLANLSNNAVKHWSTLIEEITPIQTQPKKVEIQQLREEFLMYRKSMSLNFLFLPQLFETLKVISPVNFLITDINKIAVLSYVKGITFKNNSNNWHISLSSESLSFILKNDFGFDATHVNGRFRLGQNNEISEVINFFTIQKYYQTGFGINHPITSAKFLLSVIVRKLKKRASLV